MSFLEAALQVLRQSREPLTTAEITRRALEKGLIQTKGKTPAASMKARLYLDALKGPEASIEKVSKDGRFRSKRGSVQWRAR